MERYEAKPLCQHSQTSIEHVQWVFEILMKLKICPISHHTYINFVYQKLMYIEGCNSFKWKDMKLNLSVSIHRHPIEHVQWVCAILMKLKICPISHHTYINFVYQKLMYIEGCNSIKWRDMKLNLCVSFHRHL